jgi:hypothetical protein
MSTTHLPPVERSRVLRFAASFLWADHEVVESERRFLHELARELGAGESEGARGEVEALLEEPPALDALDPNAVPAAWADVVRHAVLRAIASDGHVHEEEMNLFHLLDALLPATPALA